MTDMPSEQPAASKDDVLENLVDSYGVSENTDGLTDCTTSGTATKCAALLAHVRAVERELAVTKEALRVAGEERDCWHKDLFRMTEQWADLRAANAALQAKAEMLAAGLSRIEDITHGTDYEGAAEDALDDILIEIEALAAYRGNGNG